jgi:hypothetical protein
MGGEMLRLVPRQDKPRTTYLQADLFPNSDPRLILLVSLPLNSGREFLQIVERSCPRIIVDLRDVPRFDFDLLNRSKVFEAFANARSTYVDMESPSKPQRRDDRWPDLFTKHKTLVEMKNGQPSGPYMFLFSLYKQLSQFEQFLQEELPEIHPSPWSIFCVTRQEEFAIQKFAK